MRISGVVLCIASTLFAIAPCSSIAADTLQGSKCLMAKGEGAPMQQENLARCPAAGMHGQFREPQQGVPLGGACCLPMLRQAHCVFNLLVLKLCLGLIFAGMVCWLTINILLTIIITSDMKKRGCLTGVWIPLLLTVGIPTAIIYASLRIGDCIKEQKS